jgi:hypothetical protein
MNSSTKAQSKQLLGVRAVLALEKRLDPADIVRDVYIVGFPASSLRGTDVHSCGVDIANREIGPSQVLTSFLHCFTLGVFKIGL